MYQKIVSFVVLFILTCGVTALADDVNRYQSYETRQAKFPYFEVEYDEQTFAVILPGETAPSKYVFNRDDLKSEGNKITAGGTTLFDQAGLRIEDSLLAYENITDILIQERHRKTAVIFYTRDPDSRRIGRVRRGNTIAPFAPVKVAPGEFVRGFILTIHGDIEINGETNKDIITLFGNITVSPDAVIRGNIMSVFGEVDIGRTATLYGDVYTGSGSRAGENYRLYRGIGEFYVTGYGYYNRVDGATPHLQVGFQDRDSLLPSIKLTGGYAFHSERGRYRTEIEQPLCRKIGLYLGGEAFQSLMSDDTRLLSFHENSVFALIATEDFMDYYEARGGAVYLRAQPYSCLEGRISYRHEETRWLEAGRNLWSLFGGEKQFGWNFPMYSDSVRDGIISQIKNGTNSFLSVSVEYDDRSSDRLYSHSGWVAGLDFEWSHPDIGSDFDYNRFILRAERFQKISKGSIFMVRGMAGFSSGELPVYRLFYLGGFGTLRGYRHKEFIGTDFWMANSEYRVKLGRTDFALSAFWDVANIPKDSRVNPSGNTNNSVGLSFYLGSDFRVSVAERLDGAADRDPKFYVRLTQGF